MACGDVPDSFRFGHWPKSSEDILESKFPLHRCCRDGDVERLTELIYASSHSVYTEDSFYGWTPAHWSCYFGKLACLRAVIMLSKVDCNVRTSQFNQTPAHIAAYGGHPCLLQWTLQCGAEVDCKDYLGETPLHKAARTGSMECVSLLVAHGASVTITNNNGHTPMQLAQSCGFLDCAKYIREREEALRCANGELYCIRPQETEDSEMDTVDACPIDMVESPMNGFNGVNGGGDAPSVVQSHYGFIPNYSPNGSAQNGVSIWNSSPVIPSQPDILLDNRVCRNSIPIAGRKRAREETEFCEVKRVKSTDNPAERLGIHLNGSYKERGFEKMMSSVYEHNKEVHVQQGYDSMMCDAMISDFHGA